MNIKKLKPRKDSRFSQGYINPESCNKLFESQRKQPIIYRSSWEKKFIYWCEMSPKVKHWGSECTCIKYYNPIDEKEHKYYPDFVVELIDGQIMIVEIKPENQTQPPKKENSWAYKTYITNQAKWKEIKKKCIDRGYKFCILTENTINRL